MEKHSSNTLKLGVFVMAGLTLFILAIYLIGRTQNLFGSNIHISAVFSDVGGLQAGNNVRFSGIDIGTVAEIEIITDSSVRVYMVIDSKVRKHIKNDSKAVIGSEGLMGNKTVNILSGTSGTTIIADKSVLATTKTFDTEAILRQVKKSADNAAAITTDMADIMHTIHSGKGTVGRLLQDESLAEDFASSMRNLKNATGGLRQTVKNLNEGTSGIGKTMSTIQEGAAGFKDNMDAAKHNFLLKGYFKKKDKELEKAKKDSIEKAKKN
jgi:phospholipid/cholesterol/gamma-HCH transport system substrate-binding protein